MDRLTKNEYLESLQEVFSEEELSLLQEVYNNIENSFMEKTDIMSLCVEVLLREQKKTRYLISGKKQQQHIIDKMKRNIDGATPDIEIEFIEDAKEEYYMDQYEDQSLERLLQLCKDSSDTPKPEIIFQKLNGIPTNEISENYGISPFKVDRTCRDAIARLSTLYYDGLSGIMDDSMYKYYLSNESPIFKSVLDRNHVLSKYKRGHVLSKTENTVYTTINEMGEESQQKTLRKI